MHYLVGLVEELKIVKKEIFIINKFWVFSKEEEMSI